MEIYFAGEKGRLRQRVELLDQGFQAGFLKKGR
jgi:hypothetical protein